MEYLTNNTHKYAAKLLAENLVGNVESALLQAEKDLSVSGKSLYGEYYEYYLIYDGNWQYPYIVKKSKDFGKTDVSVDENVKRYKW